MNLVLYNWPMAGMSHHTVQISTESKLVGLSSKAGCIPALAGAEPSTIRDQHTKTCT